LISVEIGTSLAGAAPITIASIALGATIAIAIIALRQSRIAKDQSFLLATQSILKEIGSQEIREARRRIYEPEASKKIRHHGVSLKKSGDQSEKDLAEDVERVAVSFDRIGFLVHYNTDLQWRVLDFIGFSLEKIWDICEKFIDEFIEEYKQPSYRYFREMATIYKQDKDSIHEKAWGKKTSKARALIALGL
jgi:hypothetical protein